MLRPDAVRPQLTLIDQVRLINPELASYCVLRRHTWPTAVLHRIGIFKEMGALMEDPLTYAVGQFINPTQPSKIDMLDFVLEQNSEVAHRVVLDIYRQQVLPRTRIHVVVSQDPFYWDGSLAQQRLALIGDLAQLAYADGQEALAEFSALIDAQNSYFARCNQETQRTLTKLRNY